MSGKAGFTILIKFAALAGVLYVGLLVSCSYNNAGQETQKELTLQYALDAGMARREGIVKPDYNMLRPLADERERLGGEWIEQFGEDYLVQLLLQSMMPIARAERISSSDAIADARALLWLLRLHYGAYVYYGGDEVFVPLFNRIIEELAGQDEWDAGQDFGDFAEVLHGHLMDVVIDNHVHIGNRVLGAHGAWTLSPYGLTEMPLGIVSDFFVGTAGFERSVRGFRSKENGLYVVSVSGYDIEQVFRLSIADSGELVYKPVIVVPGRTESLLYLLELVYENGEHETISLYRHDANQRRTLEQPSLARRNGIPVVNIMRMGFHPNEAYARQFLAYAEKLRDEDIVIIDIRSNMGGNNLLSAQFLHRLTGEIVPTNSIILNLGNHRQMMDALAAVPSDSPFYRPLDDFETYHPTTSLGEGHFVWNYTADRLVPNEQLIIFLTDRHTKSAGEGFIDLALNLQNSLIIGQNTAGVISKTGGPAFFLPNSGVIVGFGPGIFFYPDDLISEGVGFAPDIWAIGDALDAALVLVQLHLSL